MARPASVAMTRRGCSSIVAACVVWAGCGAGSVAVDGRSEASPAGAGSPTSEAARAACRPEPSAPAVAVRHLAAGRDRTCAVLADGGVRCWGGPWAGGGSRGGLPAPGVAGVALRPAAVPGIDGARQVAVGATFGCVLSARGEVLCFGTVPGGQGARAPAPAAVAGLDAASSLRASADRACVVTHAGAVRCVGGGESGGAGGPVALPTGDLDRVSDLFAGDQTTCVVGSDRRVRCWGRIDGEPYLGLPGEVDALPAGTWPVGGAVAAAFGCLLGSDGTVWCWGRGTDGELGDGRRESSAAPRRVLGLRRARHVGVGGSLGCAVLDDGTVRCWGTDGCGAVEQSTRRAGLERHSVMQGVPPAGCKPSISPAPVPVPGLPCATRVAVADLHACALTARGGVWCWGNSTWGQLGDGTRQDRREPRPVSFAQDE